MSSQLTAVNVPVCIDAISLHTLDTKLLLCVRAVTLTPIFIPAALSQRLGTLVGALQKFTDAKIKWYIITSDLVYILDITKTAVAKVNRNVYYIAEYQITMDTLLP